MASKDDPFTTAYLAGMPDTLEGTGPVRPRPRTLPREAIALGGQVITPDGVRKGWVRIEGGTVAAITTRKPTTALAIQTDGVIMPGMLDLHGHPEFNVFAPWEPPKSYVNRYSWRASKPYQDLVRTPQNDLLTQLPKGVQLRYAEIRALVGGVTAIQGASIVTQKGSHESMVRNVDGMIFGEHRARAAIDLPTSLTGRGGPEFQNVLDAITAGEVDAHYLHLAEGMRDNERSQKEFDLLADTLKGLTKATVIIHGTALSRDQLGQAADAGARLVWSPQSNLRLYGETTRAGDALDVGLPMALGADWLPSGSMSLLGEMKVARQQLVEQDHPITAEDLVTMVTSGAAEVAALGGKLGSLEVGRVADLVVMARQDDDAYESVCESTPADVELVMIGGDVAYGRADWVTQLAADAADPDLEPVLAWGRSMLLDTSFEVVPGGDPTPRLSSIRSSLTKIYPPVGPIWA
ncbi:amidohydrolase family protein [Marmoricola sp. URHB0036]|uniref:amidohydrolase family protein n=1 Tax=Marmoricola sp. URHB0036 TaxID=1298863 RepID=UPI000560D041|nr:amidohydrolase family protein [Marmoricola sp. URHB0036]